MDKILKMRAERGEVITSMRALLDKAEAEKRDLTAEETAQYDAMKSKCDKMEKDIKRLEDLEAIEAAAILAKPAKPGNGAAAVAMRPRYGKLVAFRGDGAEERAYRSGQWIAATLFGNAAAAQWCADHGMDIRNAQSGNVNTKGGVLVPDEFESAIIDLREEYGVFRREANVMPMARDTLVIPRRTGGLTAYFTSENPSSAITESDATWDNVSLTAKKLATLTRMSSEIAEDAVINMADWLAREIAYAFATKEDDCGFNGDGTSTYGGIVGVRPKIIDGNHTAGAKDAASGIDTFAEVTATDLATMMAALPKYALRNAKFYCSQPAFSLVFERLVAAAGGNTIDTMAGSVQPRYLGYPVVVSQSMPTSTGDLSDVAMLLFGDLKLAATMGVRRDVTVALSNDRYFDTDQIGIRGTERFDINVHDLGDTSTAGPIVALIGE